MPYHMIKLYTLLSAINDTFTPADLSPVCPYPQ